MILPALTWFDDQVSPVLMGHFIRTRMLCQSVPAPTEDIDTTLPDYRELDDLMGAA